MKTKKHRMNKEKHEERDVVNEVAGGHAEEDELNHADGGVDQLNQQQQPTRRVNTFNKDLCTALISSDIPINKLSTRTFSSFLEKYTGHKIPDQTTIRKYYVKGIYDATIDVIRKKADGKKIWISIDETTDVQRRYIACFIFGILGEEEERRKCYLANVAHLKSANHSTIAAFFNDSLKILWPRQILYGNILIVTTDAAAYMCKAMNGLKVLFPKMVHVTCLAHGLHRIAELVRSNYPQVNRLISSTKSIFLKSPKRVEKFKELYPDIPLPPLPIATRWGTWLTAAEYYSAHLEEVTNVVMELDETEAESIAECKQILNDAQLKFSLSHIATKFTILSKTIKRLETRGLSIESVVDLVGNVKNTLERMYDRSYYNKFMQIMEKNEGFSTVTTISAVISGKIKETEDEITKTLSSFDLSAFKYAPVVSCDAERFFSVYKNVLADNRRSFHFVNLKYHLIIKCNENQSI